MGNESFIKISGFLLIIFFFLLFISTIPITESQGGNDPDAKTIPENYHTITFDRRLTGYKVGQHKVPPLSSIIMTITVTASEFIENEVLIDYYPNSWKIIDPSNGTIKQHNSEYNKIEWNVNTINNSISRAYTILSPERTIPPTNYFFQSELAGQKSKEWRVIVADPPDAQNLTVNGIIGTWDDGGTVDYLNESDDTRGLTSGGAVVGVDFENWNSGAWGDIQSVSGVRIWYEHAEESGFNVNFNIEVGNSADVDVYSDNALQSITIIESADNSFTTTEAIAEEAFAYYDCPSYPTTEAGINDLQVRFVNNDGNDQAGIDVVYAEITYTSVPADNPPTYAYNGTNVTSGSIVAKGTQIKIYANWTDDNGLNYTWYQSNETSSWVNSTAQVLTGWSNFTIDTSGFNKGETFGTRIFANDTGANENYTVPTWYWTIDADPAIQGNAFINNTTAVVGQGVPVKWNVTITDDVDVNITFFQNNTINITATEGTGNEWYIEKTCSVSGAENWTAIYVNDSIDQWSSNTSVNLTWECDANAPTVVNTAVNDTAVNTSDIICVNHTVTDTEGNLDKTWVQITFPNSTVTNITTSNTTGVCGSSGGNISAVRVNVGTTTGNLTINTSFANDTAAQIGWQSPFPNLVVNVSAPSNTPPTIVKNAFINNTTAVVGQGVSVKWNVTVTDAETEPSIVLFQNNTANITASNTSSEYWIEKTCTADEYIENWTAIYTNDTIDLWSSNKTVNLAWGCDASAPRVENETASGTIEIYNNITYRFNTSDNNLDKVWINLTIPSVSETNYTATQEGGTGWYLEINATELGNYYFEGFANDTLGQENKTDTIIIVTGQDTAKPKWSSNTTSPTPPVTYVSGQSYQFNVTWTDNLQVNETILEFDGVNYSYISGEISKSGSEYYKNFTDLSADSYNYSWYANDTSNNWNSTDQLIYQVSKAPTQTNLTLNDTDSAKTYEWGEIANLTAVLNVSSKTVYIDANYTGIFEQIASDTDSSVTNFTDTGKLNLGKYNITGYFSGDQNYSTSFETHYMTVQDTVKPQYSSLKNTSAVYNQDFQANATWNDNYQLDKVLFESNYTGTLQNYTVTTYSASEYYYTILSGNQTMGKITLWKWFANDTTNNWNSSSQFNYTAAKAPTEIILWLNETRGSKSYMNNTYANFTVQLNVSNKTIYLTSNVTGFGTISNTTSVIYNVTHLTDTGTFNMTGYWDGDENYTADSETWYATVTAQNMQASFVMTPTSMNQEENSTVSANCTCIGGTCTNSFMEIESDGSPISNVTGSNLQVNVSSAYNLETINDGGIKNVSWIITGHNTGTYVIRIKCNSTETGDSLSTTQNLQVNDTTKPTWSNNQTDKVTTHSSTTLSYFNITWSDNVEINKAVIEGNWSGSSRNYTMLNYSSVYSYNETLPAGTFYWKSYANDTTDNWNISDIWHFTIAKGPTLTKLFLNGTEGNRTYGKTEVANITATVNITGKNIQLWTDFTGTMENVSNSPDSTPLTNITNTANLNLSTYNITAYFAEEQNYTKSAISYQMEVYKKITFNGTMKNAKGSPVNVTIKIYKPDTDEMITNVSTNATGHYNATFNSTGFHDVLINVFSDSIKLLRANLSENLLETLALDSVPIENITISATRVTHKGLSAKINLTYQNVTICLNYTSAPIEYESTIKIFKCQDWNFTYRSCNGTWSKLGGTINTTSDTICINQTNFSAYAAAEAIECGNGICESTESSSSCSQDCPPAQPEEPVTETPSGYVPKKKIPSIKIIVDEYIQISQGDKKLVNVLVENTGNVTIHNVSLQTKGIEEHWREILDQNLNIGINESATIRMVFEIPPLTLTENYSMKLIISSNEINDSIIVILEIKPKSVLMQRFEEMNTIIKDKIDRFVNLIGIIKEKGIPTGLAEGFLSEARRIFTSAIKVKGFGNYTGAVALLLEADVFLNSTSSSIEDVITTEFGRLTLMVKLTLSFTLFITIILIYDKRKKIIRALRTVYKLVSNLRRQVPKAPYEKPIAPKIEVPEEVPKMKKKAPNLKLPKFKKPKIRLPKITIKIPKVKKPKIKLPKIKAPKVKMPKVNVRKVEVSVRAEVKKIRREMPKIRVKFSKTKRLKLKAHKMITEMEDVMRIWTEKIQKVEISKSKLLKLKVPRVKPKVPKIKPPKVEEIEGVMKIKFPKIPKTKKLKIPKFPIVKIPETMKKQRVEAPRLKLPRMEEKIPKRIFSINTKKIKSDIKEGLKMISNYILGKRKRKRRKLKKRIKMK